MNRAVKVVLREPLAHFVVFALLLFVAERCWDISAREGVSADAARLSIVITPEQVRRLGEGYFRQYGALPSAAQQQALIDQYIREEVLYREGLLLGLDRDDEIIRRRLAQKVEFLQQDLDAPSNPSAAQLAAYYQEHRARYTLGERRSFTHIFFSPDKGGEERARDRALRALKELLSDARVRAPERGDVFAGLYDYASLGVTEVFRVFGDSAFSSAVFTAPVGQWSGPYRSGLGWHLLLIQGKEPARMPPLEDILDTVRADFTAEVRQNKNAVALEKLRSKYTVVRQDEAPGPVG